MNFENKTKEPIKVEKEKEDPKQYATVYPGKTIEASTTIFQRYYADVGMVAVDKPAPAEKVEAVEGKAGQVKVETKVKKKKK